MRQMELMHAADAKVEQEDNRNINSDRSADAD